MSYDFSGWATRFGIKCSDGRTIAHGAFKECDGKRVPMVYMHDHSDIENVIGHADLKYSDQGVYAYCTLNNTDRGNTARELIKNGDINGLSIWANRLKQQGGNVLHGDIKEVSLVLASANPGAYIDSVLIHGEYSDEDGIIFAGEKLEFPGTEEETTVNEQVIEHADQPSKSNANGGKDYDFYKKIYEGMGKDQKETVEFFVGLAVLSEQGNSKGEKDMKHNAFDNEEQYTSDALSHDQMNTIISDAKRYGSMRDSFLAHADEYGIEDIEYLFPDAKNLDVPPQWIKRDTEWVGKVMSGTKHSPFSRIKSMFADITADEARARGYTKGNRKVEEVFGLLKRTTTPTTIYKKQKMDRDDMIDITWDVIPWLKTEMRMMLDEEIARAILLGDGRSAASDDKINEQCIRPIVSDDDLFTIKKTINVTGSTTEEELCKMFIRTMVKSRKEYKGSGNLTLFTTEDLLADMMLMEDGFGHRLYKNEQELASAMRVKEIVTVPLMENQTTTTTTGDGDTAVTSTSTLMGIAVNLSDYNVGADKGGSVSMFEDFDIDYNQQKYLIETRCSGALIKPYSAIVISSKS